MPQLDACFVYQISAISCWSVPAAYRSKRMVSQWCLCLAENSQMHTPRTCRFWAAIGTMALVPWITVYGQTALPSMPAQPNGFIANHGQLRDQLGKPASGVHYLLHGQGLNIQLRAQGFSYDAFAIERPSDDGSGSVRVHRIDIDLLGTSPAMQILPEGRRPDHFNYYGSPDHPDGIEQVPHYDAVRYADAYPGVDIVFRTNAEGRLEYDLYADRVADLASVRLKFSGADRFQVDGGRIALGLSFGELEERIPESWQVLGGERVPVEVRYVALGGGEVGFSVVRPVMEGAIVVDPTPSLLWGTYYAFGGGEYCRSVITKGTGVYFAGYTGSISTNFATTGAFQTALAGGIDTDAFLAKFTSAGARTWCTYYGAGPDNGGYGNDYFEEITADGQGNIIAIGSSITPPSSLATTGAFMTTMAGATDVLLVKFSPSGSRLWGTFFGGELGDYGTSVCLDASGNILITGTTKSATGISTSGAHQTALGGGDSDGFLAKLNSNATSLTWSTYYGGTEDESHMEVRLTGLNRTILAGTTASTSNIASSGAFQSSLAGGEDVFMAAFDNAGVRSWATYYGGTANDRLEDMAVDCHGAFFVGGFTQSSGLGTAGVHQQNKAGSYEGFVSKFGTLGTRVWTTYYGGADGDVVYGLLYAGPEMLYIAGTTSSSSGIATPGSQQPTYTGQGSNGYLALLNDNGIRQWGTYYGGIYTTTIQSIGGSASIYATGTTNSPGSIATTGAFQTSLGGSTATYNGFLAKFSGSQVQPCVVKSLGDDSQSEKGVVYSIAPNPGSGRFILYNTNAVAGMPVRIHAVDGRLVRSFSTSGVEQEHLDISLEPDGLYTVHIGAGSVGSIFRIIKH
jgi:hypothetical protein